jgi:hypothetical protein
LMDKMCEVNPKTQHYGIFVYTPFPSPVMEFLPPKFKAPQSLEEWSNIHVFHFDPHGSTKRKSKNCIRFQQLRVARFIHTRE